MEVVYISVSLDMSHGSWYSVILFLQSITITIVFVWQLLSHSNLLFFNTFFPFEFIVLTHLPFYGQDKVLKTLLLENSKKKTSEFDCFIKITKKKSAHAIEKSQCERWKKISDVYKRNMQYITAVDLFDCLVQAFFFSFF